jgi:predicted helicase
VSPEEVVDYVYAVLHSRAYRDKHKEALKTAFPRVPIPTDDSGFERLATIGARLRDLHLLRAAECDELITSYPIAGTDVVESVAHREEKVWINSEQYFGNVSEDVWTMRIGGYQPAQKWLKDRKGRSLNNYELVHYQRIIAVLAKTATIMDEIDA